MCMKRNGYQSRIQFVLYTLWKGMNSYFLLLPQQQGIVDSLALGSDSTQFSVTDVINYVITTRRLLAFSFS